MFSKKESPQYILWMTRSQDIYEEMTRAQNWAHQLRELNFRNALESLSARAARHPRGPRIISLIPTFEI